MSYIYINTKVGYSKTKQGKVAQNKAKEQNLIKK
jgi:hypothetical protein